MRVLKYNLFVLFVLIQPAANAELQGRLPLTENGSDYQAIYDTELDITWLADANYAATSGYFRPVLGNLAPEGWLTFDEAHEFVRYLNDRRLLGITRWRLPKAPLYDPTCSLQYRNHLGVDVSRGEGCLGSELGHLTNADGVTNQASGFFLNLRSSAYWSDQEQSPDTAYAHSFSSSGPSASFWGKTSESVYVLPVMDGDISTAEDKANVTYDYQGLQITASTTWYNEPESCFDWQRDGTFSLGAYLDQTISVLARLPKEGCESPELAAADADFDIDFVPNGYSTYSSIFGTGYSDQGANVLATADVFYTTGIQVSAPSRMDVSLIKTGNSQLSELQIDRHYYPVINIPQATLTEAGEYSYRLEPGRYLLRSAVSYVSGTAFQSGIAADIRFYPVPYIDAAVSFSALPDVTGDAAADFVVLNDAAGTKEVAVISGSDGEVAGEPKFFSANWELIAHDVLRELVYNGVASEPVIAVLARQKETGQLKVQVREAAGGMQVGSNIRFLNSGWKPIAVVIIGDTDGDGVSDDASIGVLARNLSTGRNVVELRLLENGSLISRRGYFTPLWEVKAVVAHSQSGALPKIGVMATDSSSGKTKAQFRAADTGHKEAMFLVGAGIDALDMEITSDIDSDGIPGDFGVVVLGRNLASLNSIVRRRRLSDGAPVGDMLMVGNPWQAYGLSIAADMDIDELSEIAAISTDDNNGTMIKIRNLDNGAVVNNLYLK